MDRMICGVLHGAAAIALAHLCSHEPIAIALYALAFSIAAFFQGMHFASDRGC
jgi:hypothetical protein